jgi:hypothetical protein
LVEIIADCEDLTQQQRVKCAIDSTQIVDPGKVFLSRTAASSSTACISTRASRNFWTCRGSNQRTCVAAQVRHG